MGYHRHVGRPDPLLHLVTHVGTGTALTDAHTQTHKTGPLLNLAAHLNAHTDSRQHPHARRHTHTHTQTNNRHSIGKVCPQSTPQGIIEPFIACAHSHVAPTARALLVAPHFPRYISTHTENMFGPVGLDVGVAGNSDLYLMTMSGWPSCEDLIYGAGQ